MAQGSVETGSVRSSLWTVVVVVLGLSGGAVLVSRSGGVSATPSSASPAELQLVAPAPTPPPPDVPRALGLVADFIGDPLFRDPENGGEVTKSWQALVGETPPDRQLAKVVERLRAKATDDAVDVEFLIATIPDYVDSSSGWRADSTLAAIQRAAAAAGWQIDHFSLPGWRSAETPAARGGAHDDGHDREPGGLLFRRVERIRSPGERPHGSGFRAHLLLVLLVPEAATSGLHQAALDRALSIPLTWDCAKEVRVLGPTFSGSAYSLRSGLRRARERWGTFKVDIATGSATSPVNRRMVDVPGLEVKFFPLVRSDPETLVALADFLGRIDPGWRCGERMALLIESNTTWGSQFSTSQQQRRAQSDSDTTPRTASERRPSAELERPRDHERGRLRSGDGKSDDSDQNCSLSAVLRGQDTPFARALRIPFPLHISRLRSESTPRTGTPASAASPLQLGEGPTPTDRVPPFTPAMTAAVAETMLAGIFRTLRTGDYTALGILASDKRDHLFLAQELAVHAPHLQVFAIESDLLYLHANAGAFLRGTLVASTYPLHDRTQLLVPARGVSGWQRRVPFESSAAEGVFNAFLRLSDKDSMMVDYGAPGTGGLAVSAPPPVWISVVGRGALLPLEPIYPEWVAAREQERERERGRPTLPPNRRPAYAWGAHELPAESTAVAASPSLLSRGLSWVSGDAPSRGVVAASAPPPSIAPSGYTTVPPGIAALALGLGALLLAHAAFVGGWMHVAREERSASASRPGAVPRRMRRIVLIRDRCRVPPGGDPESYKWHARIAAEQRVSLFACGSAVVVAGVWLLQLGWIWFADTMALPVYVPVRLSLLRDVALIGVVLAIPFGFPSLLGRHRPQFFPFRVVPLATGLVALAGFRQYLDGPLWTGVPALLTFERAVSPGTFVSPTPAILVLCGGLYAWGVWNTHRLALVSPPDPSSGVFAFLKGRGRGCDLDDCVHQPLMRMGGWTSLVPLAALAALLPAWSRQSGTVEGRPFSLFLFFGAVCLVTALAHTLAHSVHLGRILLAVLQSLERHPIAPAFTRVGNQPFPWGLSFQRARPADLEPLAGCAARLAETVAFVPPRSLSSVLAAGYGLPPTEPRRSSDKASRLLADGGAATAGAAVPTSVGERARALELGVRVQDVREMESLRAMPRGDDGRQGRAAGGLRRVADARTAGLRDVALARPRVLEHLASGQGRRGPARPLLPAGRDDPRVPGGDRRARHAPAARLGLSLAMGGLVLLTTLHLVYAFQGRRFWLAFDWASLGVTSLLAVTLLVGLEKNAVLSRLWATQPGRVSLTGGLIYRIVGYAAVPVLMIFSTVFPELIGNVAGWVERIRPALP